MKFTIQDIPALKKAISTLKKLAAKSAEGSAQRNLQVTARDNEIRIESSGDSLDISFTMYAEVSQQGQGLIDATFLSALLSKVKVGPVLFFWEEDEFHITVGTKKFKTQSLPVSHFPSPIVTGSKGPNFVISPSLIGVLDSMAPCTGSDSVERPNLMYVQVEIKKEGYNVCATDGHRMLHQEWKEATLWEGTLSVSRHSIPFMVAVLTSHEPLSVTVSKKGHTWVQGAWEVNQSEPNLMFPDYRQILKTPTHSLCTVSANAFQSALDAVSLVNSEKRAHLHISPAGMRVLSRGDESSLSDDIGGMSEGPSCGASYNAAFLYDALKSVQGRSGNVRIGLSDTLSPTHITSPDAPGVTAIVMPMRDDTDYSGL